MSNPAGKRDDAPLSAEVLERLRKATGNGTLLKASKEQISCFDGVGVGALTRALAGLPVRGATRRLIELGLEQIDRSDRCPIHEVQFYSPGKYCASCNKDYAVEQIGAKR